MDARGPRRSAAAACRVAWRAAVARAVAGRAEAPRGRDAVRGEAFLELLGGLAVEGEHEDARGVRAALDELQDAADERLGLARARRREDASRAAGVLDGRPLGGVERRLAGIRVGSGDLLRRGRRESRCASWHQIWHHRWHQTWHHTLHPQCLPSGRAGGCRRRRDRHGASRPADAEEPADVLEVERGGVAEAQATRREHLSAEGEPEAVGEASGDERVDEPKQDGRGLLGQLLLRAAPEPETDGGLAVAEKRPPGLAGVARPRSANLETDARSGRRRSLREVAAAAHVEEDQARPAACVPAVNGCGHEWAAGRLAAPAAHRR